MTVPPTSIGQRIRVLQHQQPEHGRKARKRRQQDRADIVNDAAGADAQALQPDRHGERDADLQRNLGEAGALAIDVATVDGMADFHERQQHREQDRRRLHRPQRRIVAAAAQEDAAGPERCRRNAVAPQQPVEDRRGADGVADNARLVADPQHHDAGEDRGQRAQEPDRPLQRNPGGAGRHQRQRDREPAFFQREGQRQRHRGERAGRKQRDRKLAVPGGRRACSGSRSRRRRPRPAPPRGSQTESSGRDARCGHRARSIAPAA